MVETSPLNSSLKTFSVGSGASMITCCPLGRIMLGFPASVSASTFPMMTPWPVAIEDASVAWMLVRASGSTSGWLGDGLHNCCPSPAILGMARFRTREAATVFVLYLLPCPMMIVPSGTTSLTPRVWLSARASAAGIAAATALSSQRFVICVAPTCLSWATSGACMDAAVAFRACRWARLAGRLVSWSRNTTTTRSRLPDERALTWPGLSLEKLSPGTPARAAEAALACAAPVIAVTASAAAPSNEAALRAVKDISAASTPAPCGGSLDVTQPHSGVTPVPPLDQGRVRPAHSSPFERACTQPPPGTLLHYWHGPGGHRLQSPRHKLARRFASPGIGPRHNRDARLRRAVVVGFCGDLGSRDGSARHRFRSLPAVSAGERASGCPEKRWSGAGSNRRPSASRAAVQSPGPTASHRLNRNIRPSG